MNKDDVRDFFFETLALRRLMRLRRRRTNWALHGGIGLGVGLLAGVSLGMLLAPKSGREVRRDLKQGAQRFGEKARSAALRAKEQQGERFDEIGAREGYANNLSR